MVETINLADELRIRRVDPQNVTVERFITAKDGKTRWEPFNGCGRGPYCANEADACVWVLNHGLVDDSGETDLAEAVKRYEAAAKKLQRAVTKAMGA